MDNITIPKNLAAFTLAALVAVVAIFALAKPSEAADPILTVEPTSADFGSVQVGADPATQTITVTNTGGTDLVLNGVEILGVDTGTFTTSIDPATGLTVLAGETAKFTVSFDPLKTGLQTAQLTFNSLTDLLGTTVSDVEAPTVSLTGQGVSANPQGSNCTITGSDRKETLRGTADKDVICALGGNDNIDGLGNNDVLKGGSGNDRITDKAGKDKLLGQRGGDRLNAREGQRGDVFKGGAGKDRIVKDRKDRGR